MGQIRNRVDVVVSLWIDEDADIADVLQEMDYTFNHPAIKETEIVEINTEV